MSRLTTLASHFDPTAAQQPSRCTPLSSQPRYARSSTLDGPMHMHKSNLDRGYLIVEGRSSQFIARIKCHDASEGYMNWNTPRILEVCAGYEVTAYSGAELDEGEILS
jgi:hypothetical protein